MDNIFHQFLAKQNEDATAITAASDVVEVKPIATGDGLPQHFLVRFHCRTFVKAPGGQIEMADLCDVGVYFGDDHLRRSNSYEVLTVLRPTNVFHPNIQPPF